VRQTDFSFKRILVAVSGSLHKNEKTPGRVSFYMLVLLVMKGLKRQHLKINSSPEPDVS
jgi:hypothetical protein